MPLRTSSSTTYCTIGFRATGSISLGCDLVAGSSRVPTPATGTIALLITTRLYLMEGKEKANGRRRATRRAAAEDRTHRSQIRRCNSGQASHPGARPASGAVFCRGTDSREGGRDFRRRAFRNREAYIAIAPAAWTYRPHRLPKTARFASAEPFCAASRRWAFLDTEPRAWPAALDLRVPGRQHRQERISRARRRRRVLAVAGRPKFEFDVLSPTTENPTRPAAETLPMARRASPAWPPDLLRGPPPVEAAPGELPPGPGKPHPRP